MDDQSVNLTVKDIIISSKNFPSTLQPVESVTGELKVKDEPMSEEAETEVAYQFGPSINIPEDESREIKAESTDAASEDLVSPAGSMSVCTDSYSVDTNMIIKKEEDLGICFDEADESVQSNDNVCMVFGTESDFNRWDKTRAILTLNRGTDESGGDEHSSEVPAVSSHVKAGASTGNGDISRLQVALPAPVSECVFRCLECESSFQTRQLLTTHQATRHGKRFSCFLCPAAFSRNQELRLHLAFHSNEKLSFCEQSSAKEQLAQQMNSHSDQRSSSGGKKLEIHLRALSAEKPLSSRKCLATYATLKQSPYPKRYQCARCFDTFSSESGLLKHLPMHRNKRLFSCTRCAATFRTVGYLNRHFKVHSNKEPLKKSQKKFTLFDHHSHVPLDTEENSPLREEAHLVVKTNKPANEISENEVPSISSAVEAGVSTERDENSSLATVAPVPNSETSFQCSDCRLKLEMLFLLKNHLAVCHGKPYFCIDCSMAFWKMGELKLHLATHSQARHFFIVKRGGV